MLKKVFRAHLCYFSLLKATTDSGLFIKSVPSGPKLLCAEPVQVLCVCSCCQWSALCRCCVGVVSVLFQRCVSVVSALCQCCVSVVSLAALRAGRVAAAGDQRQGEGISLAWLVCVSTLLHQHGRKLWLRTRCCRSAVCISSVNHSVRRHCRSRGARSIPPQK